MKSISKLPTVTKARSLGENRKTLDREVSIPDNLGIITQPETSPRSFGRIISNFFDEADLIWSVFHHLHQSLGMTSKEAAEAVP